jgi:hypothetical protein
MNWSKLKGYAIHAGASAILFLTPAVQAWAASHKVYASVVVLGWGFLLHWSDGK